MNKIEKIKLLIGFLSKGEDTEQLFLNMIERMELPGDEEDAATLRKAMFKNFLLHFEKYRKAQITLWDKFLSEAAINAAIAFYTAPEGEEIARQMPKIGAAVDGLCYELNKSVLSDMMNITDGYSDPDP